jgi:competence protein ComEC
MAIAHSRAIFPSPTAPRAPLVPVALGVTAGITADRALSLAFPVVAGLFLLGVVGWFMAVRRPGRRSVIGIALACAALGALHHRQYRAIFGPDDIGWIASAQPQLIRVRGVLTDTPEVRRMPIDPLRSIPRPDTTRADLSVTLVENDHGWRAASGRVRLTVAGALDDIHAGDTVEVNGWLSSPIGPANPGEFDWAEHARDERIRANLNVRKTPHGVVRLESGWSSSAASWMAAIRGWGRRTLEASLPPDEAAVAVALLLGDGSAMTNDDWAIYIRTGVIHALAISGQHLVVLAAFLWLALRLAGVRRKRGAWLVGLSLFAYALITGGRPPAMRSAVQVAAICGAIVLRRISSPGNTFALAWLAVLLLKPTDIADTGCLLSFLCVGVLIWGISPWFEPTEVDPLHQLIVASRPAWLRVTIAVGKWIAAGYIVTLVLGLAVMPLTGSRYHLISLVGILIGPPVVLLTSIALISGFLLLLIAAIVPSLAMPFAWLTQVSLSANTRLVTWADRLPTGHVYVGDVPDWWLLGFYAGLFATMLMPMVRHRWKTMALAAIVWLAVGLLPGLVRPRDDALRVTFLAVGHGGCTVFETPDGRTILFDAGTIGGPEIAQRVIAPYLWHRGIHRIDDILISHADLDHFNGLPALLERFRVGRVLITPTFSAKPTPGVYATLKAITDAGVSMRIIHAGDRLVSGDVTFDVLHPPAAGPDGVENFRSMTVRVEHAGHSLLLTGDLQGSGLESVLTQKAHAVDVLQAPHHGSRTSNTPAVAAWARPRVVVSCEGPPTWPTNVPMMYADHGARYLGTWPHGAVTFVSHKSGLIVETFCTREKLVVRSGNGK